MNRIASEGHSIAPKRRPNAKDARNIRSKRVASSPSHFLSPNPGQLGRQILGPRVTNGARDLRGKLGPGFVDLVPCTGWKVEIAAASTLEEFVPHD